MQTPWEDVLRGKGDDPYRVRAIIATCGRYILRRFGVGATNADFEKKPQRMSASRKFPNLA